MKPSRSHRFVHRFLPAVVPVAAVVLGLIAQPARGIPAFARKYTTSCLTCHTIYPKLNPFGEAFRRNGYRFPGVDSDAVKQENVPLSPDVAKKQFPNSVWPGVLPPSIPIAVGFNGDAVFHPKASAGGTQADNGAKVNITQLVGEGHLWAGGSFDDQITFFGELTTDDTGTSIEHASVHFNDLLFGKHAFNVVVGKDLPVISSFGPHSSYVADMLLPALSTTALYGATSESWNVTNAYNEVEVNGTVGGRFDYSAGVNAGSNIDVQNPNDFYAHLGYKLGGMPLDAEASSAPPDPMKPWAEQSLTFDTFYYRSISHFTAIDGSDLSDGAKTYGGAIRAQWGSWELNTGLYKEKHDAAMLGATGVDATAQFNELSWVAYPWLVPAVRLEYLRLRPNVGPEVSDTRWIVGAAILARANLKFTLTGWIESASGAPPGGWGPAGGFAIPVTPTGSVGREVEAITVGMAYAF
ncbi:MAG: hypothetical protein ACHQQS_09010 [Thermoanaerobaculales bacterium]